MVTKEKFDKFVKFINSGIKNPYSKEGIRKSKINEEDYLDLVKNFVRYSYIYSEQT